MSIYEIVIGDVHTLYMEDVSFKSNEVVECRAVACEYPATTFVHSDENGTDVPFCKFCTGHILMYTVGNPVTVYPYSTTFTRVVRFLDDDEPARTYTSINEAREHRLHDVIQLVRTKDDKWYTRTTEMGR
jgi:hypothetical protein